MALGAVIHNFSVQLSHVDRGVYRALERYGLDRALVKALVARLERRMAFDLSVTDGVLYLTLGDELLSGPVNAHRLAVS